MYCLDTYALVELHDGSSSYTDIMNDDFVVTEITLAEFYGVIYRRLGEKTATYWADKLSRFIVPVNKSTLLDAAKYKEDHKKEDLSFFDCVGYVYAREHKMQFVTGDKAFKGKQGVLFIK